MEVLAAVNWGLFVSFHSIIELKCMSAIAFTGRKGEHTRAAHRAGALSLGVGSGRFQGGSGQSSAENDGDESLSGDHFVVRSDLRELVCNW